MKDIPEKIQDLYRIRNDATNLLNRLQCDTWGNNAWLDLMSELLQRKEGHWDEKKENFILSEWPETITWDSEELRVLIQKIEMFWLGQMENLYLIFSDEIDYQIKEFEARSKPPQYITTTKIVTFGEPIQCNVCNEYYDGDVDSYCTDCCPACQDKCEHEHIDNYCSNCQEEIKGALDERDAITRGDYL
tara:strand:- start:2308 stop:2874 length:567 start_codon:yes stop_codon:yes gene_type:complete